MSFIVQFVFDDKVIKRSNYKVEKCCRKSEHGWKIQFSTNGNVAHHLKLEIQKKSSFRKVLAWNLIGYTEGHVLENQWPISSKFSLIQQANDTIDFIVMSSLLCGGDVIKIEKDILSSVMFQEILNEKIQLEYLMALLSTLGGAHSSLGEFSIKHSIKAGEISLQQFRIACRLADPCIISRCKIYLSHSLMQRGHLKKAALIIRNEYKQAKHSTSFDNTVVLKCCFAAWNKYKYLKALKKENRIERRK